MISCRTTAPSYFVLDTNYGNARTQMLNLFFSQPRTMNAQIGCKRSRLTSDSDEDESQQLRQLPSKLSSVNDTLKRSKTQCELDELEIIEPKDAWTVDVAAILASTTIATPEGSGLKPHNNWQRYRKGESVIVLCVQGNLQLHYNLLWCVI